MRVNFFEQGEFEQPPDLIGTVTLDEDGKVVIPDSLAAFLSEAKVGVQDGHQVTPADGERYLEGLVVTFRGTRFWAELDGLRQGDLVNANRRESGQGDGPEIIILDPNEPDWAYAQLMAQYRRNTERGSKDGSESSED
jgi:hypothetical protein